MQRFLTGLVILSLLFPAVLAADIASYLERNPFPGTVVVNQAGVTVFAQKDEPLAYQIGSVTKIFTAIAVLKLQERGLLRLGDPLARYLSFPRGEAITIEHLLTHTSGIPDYFNEPLSPTDLSEFATQPHSIDEVITLFRDRPLHFAPGSEYRYSNSNYQLLGRLIEVVSGQNYRAFVSEEILVPLEMTQTAVGQLPQGIPLAKGQTNFAELAPGTTIDLSFYGPAGGMVSTAADLVRFGRALLEGKVLQEDSLVAMVTPRRDRYGLGWMVPRFPGIVVGGHTGRTIGYSASFLVDRAKDMVVVLLAGSDLLRTDEVGTDVFQIVRR